MKRVKQGMTRWMLTQYPPTYTADGNFLFCVNKCFVTKSQTMHSKKTGKQFNNLSVHIEDIGHYFYGENLFLKRTFKNRNQAIKQAKVICNLVNWMIDNGFSEAEIKEQLEKESK